MLTLVPIYLLIIYSLFLIFPDYSYSTPPDKWQFGFQEAVTPVMEQINDFHNFVMLIMSGVVLFVSVVLFYILFKFNKKKHPVPSTKSHNTLIEVVWTILPLLIVCCIAVPSVKLLSYEEKVPESDMVIKVVGYQWYWGYEYVDHDNLAFDSHIKYELNPTELRLFEVDNRLVVPVDTNVKIQVTSADVIHSWAMPAFGVKKDAIPGRLNETWFNVSKPGVYYGQCSELCGVLHGFMPIVVEAVSKEEFKEWLKSAKEKFV